VLPVDDPRVFELLAAGRVTIGRQLAEQQTLRGDPETT
jgi:hypothetical protein